MTATITVQADKVLHRLSPLMIGANLEDLNYQTQGGLDSQMIHGEHFQEPSPDGVSLEWRRLLTGSARGSFAADPDGYWPGRPSQRVTFAGGQGEVGIDNAGLGRWGMNLVAGMGYEGVLRIRPHADVTVGISLRSGDAATVLAETVVTLRAGREFQRVDFALTPKASDESGCFAVTLKGPGAMTVGYAFLQPGEWGRYKGLRMRKDLAEAVVAQGVKVIRYNGSMITAPCQGDYQWKKMIGPRDQRPPYRGTFNPYAGHGWGIIDFLGFCEAAGIVGVPGLNRSESPEDLGDFVEYCNGPVSSVWGRRRADDGHPEPYGLKFIQYGNEERIEAAYLEDFKRASAAIWAKDPNVTVVVSDWMYWKGIPDPRNITDATCTNLDAHVALLKHAAKVGGKVWWDVHVWEPGPRAGAVQGVRDLHAWFQKLLPEYPCPIATLEQNAGNHDMLRALGHACMSNDLSALGDFVPAAAAPNTLQAWGHYTTRGWDQGLISFTPTQVWYQPAAHVDRMIRRADCPDVLAASVQSPSDALNLSARRSRDGKAVSLFVVNVAEAPVTAAIALAGFVPACPEAAAATLAPANLKDDNTPDAPTRVAPVETRWTHHARAGRTSYTFPPNSYTILRFE